jgi:FRG domain
MRKNGQLRLNWTSDAAIQGEILLHMNKSSQPTTIGAMNIRSWVEFKKFANDIDSKSYAFRGQENSIWRLVTGYHRTNRANLFRFVREDIKALWRSFSGLNIQLFDLKDADQNGALVALAQHHGYPTPLLDWTYSPYVAAYFAFNDKKSLPSKKGGTVRIYMFDKIAWENDFLQLVSLTVAAPHFSLLEPLAMNNPRLTPQQALLTVTNLADIESYVLDMEKRHGKQYLQAIDLPVADRELVLRELRLMGITAASLFPGLDGTCRHLREEFFPSTAK